MSSTSYFSHSCKNSLSTLQKAWTVAGLLSLFLCLVNCSSSSSYKKFLQAKQQNSPKSYQEFLQNHPQSPQSLSAKVALESFTAEKRTASQVWSSEKDIAVTNQNKRFQDTNKYLQKVFSFYEAKKQRKSFIGADGIEIVYDYIPGKDAKKALVISHGTGESSIRYAEVVYDLLQNGYPHAIFVTNHRGHGYSQRLLGDNKNWNPKWDVHKVQQKEILEYRKIHVEDFNDYVKDFAQLVGIVKKEYKFEKVMALGHSLGGGVVARYAELHPDSLEKMALSSPMMAIHGAMGKDNTDYLGKSLIFTYDTFSHTGYTFGGAKFNRFLTKYDTNIHSLNNYTTSYNRFYMKKYINQEFPETSLGSLTWGFMDAIYEGAEKIRDDAEKIQTPALILQSEYDNYVHPSGQNYVCKVMNKTKAGLCKLIPIPAAKHELLLERDRVRNQVMDIFWEYLQWFTPSPQNGGTRNSYLYFESLIQRI